MQITLYYAPLTRAGRVRWLLEELEVPYELRRVDFAGGEHRRPEFGAIHPLHKLPVLEIDGRRVLESGAMCVWLADRFAERGLAPALDAPERPAYLQWFFFASAHLEPPLLEAFRARDDATRARARETFSAAARVVEAALADGRPFLLGDRFAACDVAVGEVTGWARAMGALEAHPALLEYGRRAGGRPAAKRARAD